MKKRFEWWKAIPLNAKITIIVLASVIVVGSSVGAFYFYDFTQHNPKACVMCHLMQPAYDSWSVSAHKNVTCHECHRASIIEQNRLLLMAVFKRPTTVPPRHGKVIVPYTTCIECHWEGDPKIKKINRSYGHAKHVFIEQIQCTKCHSREVHKFLPGERFCLECHKEKVVHGFGMEDLACLDCHIYKADAKGVDSKDLKPTRAKCLECHKSGAKVNFPKDGAMKFDCYQCHKPHVKAKVKPSAEDCFSCHRQIVNVGKHRLHVQMIGMNCMQCHKPHGWRVTEAVAKKECVTCHAYKEPVTFLQ